MSYYITAHKHKNKISIPIEEKHLYDTDTIVPQSDTTQYTGYSHFGTTVQTNTIDVRKRNIMHYVDSTGHSKQPSSTGSYEYSFALMNPAVFYVPRYFSLSQGTGASQRIGEKIFMKTVKIMLDIKLNDDFYKLSGNVPVDNTVKTYDPENYTLSYTGSDVGGVGSGSISNQQTNNTITTYQNNRLHYSQWAKFRIMIIRFNDHKYTTIENLKDYMSSLFNDSYVPNFIVPALSNSPYVPIVGLSNQAKMLRESTQYTGKFEKLYDETFTLGDKDPMKHIEIVLNPKKNLTFDEEDNHITNEDWNNVYGFILPPTLYTTDMDQVSYRELNKLSITTSTDFHIADFTKNIKYTYYDI